MDLFEAGCQGLGLALAAGILAGALAGAAERGADLGPISGLLLTVAVVGGAIMFGASLRVEDHPAWPGWIAGGAAAGFSLAVVRSVVGGAATRAGEQGSHAAIAGMAALSALVLAGISLTPAAPVSILVALALAYLAIGRRRRADQKHEGLRSLRG